MCPPFLNVYQQKVGDRWKKVDLYNQYIQNTESFLLSRGLCQFHCLIYGLTAKYKDAVHMAFPSPYPWAKCTAPTQATECHTCAYISY